MNSFRKYPSLDNHYAIKLQHYPQDKLETTTFVLQDKIDGSNLSIIFDIDGVVSLGSRNRWLGDYKLCNFMGVQEVLETEIWTAFIETMRQYAMKTQKLHYFYGELFGSGVIERIPYGRKNIRIFDCTIGDTCLSQIELHGFLCNNGFEDLYVPIIDKVIGIEKAMLYNETFDDPICNKTGIKAEGFVIKPWDCNIFSIHGDRLIIKKKTAEFSEGRVKMNKFEKPPMPEELQKMVIAFGDYFNNNRIMAYFSKNGRMETMRQMGSYIKGIQEDALTDFAKDMGITELANDTRRALLSYNTGKLSALLKESLMQNS